MLPVATAIQHGARFKVTASCCDLCTLRAEAAFSRYELACDASSYRENVPFILKVRALFKTRLIFPRINGPNILQYE